jgi:hypothetical protein
MDLELLKFFDINKETFLNNNIILDVLGSKNKKNQLVSKGNLDFEIKGNLNSNQKGIHLNNNSLIIEKIE